MIFNSRKLTKVVVGDLIAHVKPLNAIMQCDILDGIEKIVKNSDIVELAHQALDYALISVENLFDEEGLPVEIKRDAAGKLDKDFICGLTMPVIKELLALVIKAGNLGDQQAKKS